MTIQNDRAGPEDRRLRGSQTITWYHPDDAIPFEIVIISGGIGYRNRSGDWYTITGTSGRRIEWPVTGWTPMLFAPGTEAGAIEAAPIATGEAPASTSDADVAYRAALQVIHDGIRGGNALGTTAQMLRAIADASTAADLKSCISGIPGMASGHLRERADFLDRAEMALSQVSRSAPPKASPAQGGVSEGYWLAPVILPRVMKDAVGRMVDDFSRDHARLFTVDIWNTLRAAAPQPLAAAPEAAPNQGWRGIETAPRDGTDFLAADGDGAVYRCWRLEDAWAARCGQPVVQEPEPTHWRPLPTPPAREA